MSVTTLKVPPASLTAPCSPSPSALVCLLMVVATPAPHSFTHSHSSASLISPRLSSPAASSSTDPLLSLPSPGPSLLGPAGQDPSPPLVVSTSPPHASRNPQPRSQKGEPRRTRNVTSFSAKARARKNSSPQRRSRPSISTPEYSAVKQAAAAAVAPGGPSEDFGSENLPGEYLGAGSLLAEDRSEDRSHDDFDQAAYEEGVLRQVASLLVAVREEQVGRCAVTITADHFYLPAVDYSLTYLAAMIEGQPERQKQVSPAALFTLPPPPYQDGEALSSLVAGYKSLRRETCTHYIFLVSDSSRLLRLLRSLNQESLDLLAETVLVTQLLRQQDLLHFLQTPPVSKMVKVLLVTPSAARDEEARLLLHTHLFFQDQERISLKRLGTWPAHPASPAKRPGLQWFPEKLKNFHGFKLRATTFNHPPVSIFEPQPDGSISYDGLEIRLLRTLAFALNFTAEIGRPRDGEKWGRRLANGSWTGAVGETVRGEADVSFANYFITADRLRIMDMTRPHYIDYTCFITPKPKPLPQYTAVAWPFHVWVWSAVVATLVVVPPVVRAAGEAEPGTSWFRRLDNSFWYVWGVFLTRSQPTRLVPSSSGLRIVVISSWVAAMIISVAYKSSLIAFLLVPLPAQPVNTLEQLLESGLGWGVRDRGGWDEWFSNSLDPTSQKIAAGFQFVKGIDGGLARVLEGDFAFMNSGTFLRYLVASNFTNAFGQTGLHVAKECYVPFRIGLGLPRFSVYTSRFNDIVARVVEAGMVTRWFQDLLDKAVQKQRRKARRRQELQQIEPHYSKTQVLGLYHVQGPFILLLMGWLLAGASFLLELMVSRRCCHGSAAASVVD